MRSLKEALCEAQITYLLHNITKPEQLNLKFSKSQGWRAEFHKNETCWTEGFTTWLSGEEALELFFSCDPEAIDVSAWDECWSDE